jgi:hypothetical protein
MVEAGQPEEKLAQLTGRMGAHFARVEPLDLPKCAGDRAPDRMQRLPDRARWDTLAAMGRRTIPSWRRPGLRQRCRDRI